jgi:hypothetical protein
LLQRPSQPVAASLRHFNCMPLALSDADRLDQRERATPGSVGRASMVRKNPGGAILLVR